MGRLAKCSMFSRGNRLGIKLGMLTFGKADRLLMVNLTPGAFHEKALSPKNLPSSSAGNQLRAECWCAREP